MKDIIFKGVGTALITPFLDNSINFDEFKRLIEFQISGGADSLIIGGTTGESSTMTTNEKKYLIRFACNTINKRVPVIAGTGTNCTKTSIDLSQYAESVGADALLVVTPYYNKTTQKGLIDHYSAIANSVEIPIILYNVPSRTGLNITPETCYELSKIKNIVAIKEASGSISQVAKISSLCNEQIEKPIILRKMSWIAAEAFVGPGVTVGEGAVVGARAVVVRDVEPWNVVGGNPAKVLRKRVLKYE